MASISTRRWATSVFVAAVAGAIIAGPHVFSQTAGRLQTTNVNGREAVAGDVLVKFADGVRPDRRAGLEAQLGVTESDSLGTRTRRLHSNTYDVTTLISYLRTRSDVVYAEPNYMLYASVSPNDPRFSQLWGLLNTGQTIDGQVGVNDADIDATDAWALTTGAKRNVVAVIDTGVDYNHPDLAANIWSAPTAFTVTIGGLPVNCPAGSHGYNAITRSCDPMDDNNHGTHVSGTIGGVGNNGVGVAGVNWTASIMGAKFLSASGSGSTANAINAIDFVIKTKAYFAATTGANVRVLSNSWGGGAFSQSLLDKINEANNADMLFVAAAGNNSSGSGASYPGAYNAPNVVAVAATDNTDHLASFSNYGSNVHLAAPGVDVWSTIPNNTYAMFSGTSMATPHVSGAAALILARCPLSTSQLKSALLNNVDSIGALSGVVTTGGRLNVDKGIRSCTPPSVDLKANGSDGPLTLSSSDALSMSWSFNPGTVTTVNPVEVYFGIGTAWGVYWINPSGLTISATPTPFYTGPLSASGPTLLGSVPNLSAVPPGSYTWGVIVDNDLNGVVNANFFDTVSATIQ